MIWLEEGEERNAKNAFVATWWIDHDLVGSNGRGKRENHFFDYFINAAFVRNGGRSKRENQFFLSCSWNLIFLRNEHLNSFSLLAIIFCLNTWNC